MKRAGQAVAALGLALLAAVWGFSYSLKPQGEAVKIQTVPCGNEDGESEPVLYPGQCVEGGMAFRNQGLSGCRLRVKLCGASLDGQPVLQAGDNRLEGFVEAGSAPPEEGEYWTAKGEYLYYQNPGTGDLLPPGQETPAVYSAVRLNGSLSPEALDALRQMDGPQKLYVVLQAQPEGSAQWQDALLPD